MYKQIKRLISESSIYTAGRMLRRSFSVITMPIFTRAMATSEYGILAIARTLRDFLGVIYEVGSSASSERFYYDCKNPEEEKKLFSTLFFFTFGFGIFLSISLAAFGEPLWTKFVKDVPFYPYVPVVIFTVLMGTGAILPRTLFRVRGQAKLFVTLNFFYTLLIVVSSIISVVVLDMGALGPLLSTLVVATIFFLVYMLILRSHLTLTFSWDIVKKSLGFGLPEAPVKFGNWALKTTSLLVMQYYMSLSLVAIYSVGYAVGSIAFELIIIGFHWAVLPFYYRTAKEESEDKSKEIFTYVATYNTTIILYLALFTILMGKELLFLFASAKYAEAETVINIVAISCTFQYLFFIPSRGLYLKKKTIYFPPLLFVTVGVNVIASFLLIPPYGIVGAAWATLIAYLVRIVLTLILAQKFFFIPYDYRRLAKAIFAFAVVLILFNVMPQWPRIYTIPLKLCMIVLYPALLYFLSFFEKRELDKFNSKRIQLMNSFASKLKATKSTP
jgi:O-antigen/teichoic acid export membrane protein